MLEIGLTIEGSLERFLGYVREAGWYGRENEAVSLYAFGFLLRVSAHPERLDRPIVNAGIGAS